MTPFRILFILFLSIPLLEIYLLITVGGIIGAWPTIGLVLLTAVVGAMMLRQQGFATAQRVQAELAQGQIPAVAMMEGVVLLFSGALLLTPGFFTDAIGFLCLIPHFRQAMIRMLMSKVILSHFSNTPGSTQGGSPGGRVIEGEYQRRDED